MQVFNIANFVVPAKERNVHYHLLSLIDACREVDLEVKEEKTKYTRMLLSRQQNAGQNYNINVTDFLTMWQS
jgi:hypothetical protein